jgi:hypothetical protein
MTATFQILVSTVHIYVAVPVDIMGHYVWNSFVKLSKNQSGYNLPKEVIQEDLLKPLVVSVVHFVFVEELVCFILVSFSLPVGNRCVSLFDKNIFMYQILVIHQLFLILVLVAGSRPDKGFFFF